MMSTPFGRLLSRALALRDTHSTESRDEEVIERAIQHFAPAFQWWFRPIVRGLDDLPDGPVLFVGNHNGALLMPEVFLLGLKLHERFGVEGLPFGLGHSALILPGLNHLFVPLGGLCGSSELGQRLLEEGRRLLVFPGGELDSMRPSRHADRVIFGRRRGYIRLALRAGVPIVPVVTAGAHETFFVLDDGQWLAHLLRIDRIFRLKTWPLVACLPWGLWIGLPPPHLPLRTRLIQEFLEPIRFERLGDEAAADGDYVERCHRRVHGTMESTLRRLVAEGRALDGHQDAGRFWPHPTPRTCSSSRGNLTFGEQILQVFSPLMRHEEGRSG